MFQLVDKLKTTDPDRKDPVDEEELDAIRRFLAEANASTFMTFLRTTFKGDFVLINFEGGGKGLGAYADYPKGVMMYFTDGGILPNIDTLPSDLKKASKNYLAVELLIKYKKRPRTIKAVYTMGIGYFFNHSCNPNMDIYTAYVNVGSSERMQVFMFITNQSVKKNEALTFDYYKGVPSAAKHLVIQTKEFEGSVKCNCSPDCPNHIHAAEPVHHRDVL